jgi:phosphatidylglycerophosphate synthase
MSRWQAGGTHAAQGPGVTTTPAEPPRYHADDRSLLLPHYQRWLVEPVLRVLPARVHPNAITHAGHLANLSALLLLLWLRPQRGAWLLVAAGLVQLYVWCDNADGAHARRTGQTSAYGELLDHGLDILNVIYVGMLSAYALGLGPMGWVIVTVLTASATALTYWEQAETGVFRLGMLNQIESSLVLFAVFVVGAVFGRGVWADHTLFGVPLREAFVWWVATTIGIGMVRNVARVQRHAGRWSDLPAAVALLLCDATVIGALWLGAISHRVALAVSVAAGVVLALRMLRRRLAPAADGHRPVVRALLTTAGAIAVVTALHLTGQPPLAAARPHLDTALALVACIGLGVASLRDVRGSRAALRS